MKANELRIGNYVKCLNESRQILGITKHNGTNETELHYAEFKGLFPMKLFHLKPILISFQWLNDLRFKKYPKHWGMHKGSVCFHENNIFYKGVDIGVKVKYVHELQNLYFALTGKELEIKQ